MKLEVDVAIVGSGAGAGTVADRLLPLLAKGLKVAILEAGPYFTRNYFTQREVEMMGLFWGNGAWPTADGAITLMMGRCVGGSTAMYTGVTFRAPEEVLEDWAIPGLTPADLKPRYDRLEQAINAHVPGPDYVNDNNRLFKQGCEKLGWPCEDLKLNLRKCDQNGYCNLGCVAGAKQGTLELQIPRAVAAGAVLLPNCTVKAVKERALLAEISPAPAGSEPGPYPPGPLEVSARLIVLAAGCPGSPALLLRSRMPGLSDCLGRYITVHPAVTMFGVYPQPIKNYRGFPKTCYTPQFSKSHGYYIETCFYYPFSTAKSVHGWGAEHRSLMRRYNRLMSILILLHDPALPSNYLAVKGNRIKLNYRIQPENVRALAHAQESSAKIFFAAGCDSVHVSLADKFELTWAEAADDPGRFIHAKNFIPGTTPVSSAHPQGGCRMGLDPRTSITDPHGRVHGFPWLRVADASLFPKSSHVNPYLTIMALADRVADGIFADQRELLQK
jgi:choline dehydrogenase-like flavoprotein